MNDPSGYCGNDGSVTQKDCRKSLLGGFRLFTGVGTCLFVNYVYFTSSYIVRLDRRGEGQLRGRDAID